ncbi:MAG: zinc dependent phospholipase C family protein [Candidatus Korobacteraceae bacterium]
MINFCLRLCCLCALLFGLSASSAAYSVLTHEEVVDLLWDAEIRPLLLERFPGTSEQQLQEAHAYAYGGAVIQDLGYYPFGSDFFSDLLHYVRTGTFVENLIAEASNLNEFAFALGAMAHYASDAIGHPAAVNRAVPIEYPKLRKKYGPVVTYAEGKTEHLKTEFGFDVVQVAAHRYASQSYHDFIGFKVAEPVLERAFFDTYRIRIDSVLAHENLAIGTYRRAVSKTIPAMTRVALATRKHQIVAEYPSFSRKKFLYNLSRTDYERDWGTEYRREEPGVGARMLALILRLVPKVGPLRGLAYKDPTPATEQLYFKSVNSTVDYYRELLRDVRSRSLALRDIDLDTGGTTEPGEYSLADETYTQLADRLQKTNFASVDQPLRDALLTFFDQQTKQNSESASAMQLELIPLRVNAPAPSSLLDERAKKAN